MEIKTNYYFVDESGDLTLFDKKGKIIVGEQGVSKTFMLGMAKINLPDNVSEKLETLRKDLICDPYFKGVSSMLIENNKTAVYFHAKDDLPEVRRDVFKVLKDIEVRVQVVIKRKRELSVFAKNYYNFYGKKIGENEIYDDLVKRLFRNVLHKADKNIIYFAKRGKTNRTGSLISAIIKSKHNFENKYNIKSDKPVEVYSEYPKDVAGLQVIDYHLWALQRFYEKADDRFFNLISKNYSLIMDIDDVRRKKYGEWYSQYNPLDIKKIMPV
jgi:hypothetical protein